MSKFRATALALLVLAVGALSACGQPGAGCAQVTVGQEVTVAGHSIKMVPTGTAQKPASQLVIGPGDQPLWIHKMYTTVGMEQPIRQVDTPTTIDLPSTIHYDSGGRGPSRQKLVAVTAMEFCDHQP